MLRKIKKRFLIFTWIFCILMFLTSFKYIYIDSILTGYLFFCISFIIFPWQDKIFKKISFSNKNKFILSFIEFYLAAIMVNFRNKTLFLMILSFIIIPLPYIIFLVYKIIKSKKINK